MLVYLLALACTPRPVDPRVSIQLTPSSLAIDGDSRPIAGPRHISADTAIEQTASLIEPSAHLEVQIDPATDASMAIRMLGRLPHDAIVDLPGTRMPKVVKTTPDHDPPFCWHPMVVAPSGHLLVVPAAVWTSGVPVRPPKVVKPQGKDGCTVLPHQVAGVVASLPHVCGVPSIVPAPAASWGEVVPWLRALPDASILEAVPYDRRPVAKNAPPRRAAVRTCSEAVLPSDLDLGQP